MKENVRNPTKDWERMKKNKGRECKQKINQIEGFTVRVRFLDTGLCLVNLIDAYIKEKLLN